ncbi:ABC transporter substrate-binding protein, partial [Micrococcus luteus]|uniref:ABC transporter substrate-binding protein n=1 Tax=Micrococcus luteus TaxID=1270 RepID=UPI00366CFFD0
YLDPQLRSPAFDAGRLHSVPWQSGITGIAYNRKRLGREIRSTGDLWADDLRGKVTLLSGLDEAFALLMQGDGVDITRWTADDFHTMCEHVERRVRSKHIRRFTGNDYTADLSKGDIAACVAWAGDIIQLQADNPDIKFTIPAAGYIISSDSLLVPAQARHKTNAEKLIDYYYEPPVAARLAAYINYVCPVDGVREELAKIDESMASNTLI